MNLNKQIVLKSIFVFATSIVLCSSPMIIRLITVNVGIALGLMSGYTLFPFELVNKAARYKWLIRFAVLFVLYCLAGLFIFLQLDAHEYALYLIDSTSEIATFIAALLLGLSISFPAQTDTRTVSKEMGLFKIVRLFLLCSVPLVASWLFWSFPQGLLHETYPAAEACHFNFVVLVGAAIVTFCSSMKIFTEHRIDTYNALAFQLILATVSLLFIAEPFGIFKAHGRTLHLTIVGYFLIVLMAIGLLVVLFNKRIMYYVDFGLLRTYLAAKN